MAETDSEALQREMRRRFVVVLVTRRCQKKEEEEKNVKSMIVIKLYPS